MTAGRRQPVRPFALPIKKDSGVDVKDTIKHNVKEAGEGVSAWIRGVGILVVATAAAMPSLLRAYGALRRTKRAATKVKKSARRAGRAVRRAPRQTAAKVRTRTRRTA